jgi:hypothetical protein
MALAWHVCVVQTLNEIEFEIEFTKFNEIKTLGHSCYVCDTIGSHCNQHQCMLNSPSHKAAGRQA